MKTNQKSVRLTDREIKAVEQYRGSSFNESLSNMIYDVSEKREQMVNDWNRLQAEIDNRREELKRITEKAGKMRLVDARLRPLVDAVIALMEQA